MAEKTTPEFDLNAPAAPSLTLDAAPAAPSLTLDPSAELAGAKPEEEEKPAQPEPEEVRLSPEEQKMVDDFAGKIDITNSQQVLQYGSACQKKIGDFSEAALSKVSTKDLGEVGQALSSLVVELKGFGGEEEEKGFFAELWDRILALFE